MDTSKIGHVYKIEFMLNKQKHMYIGSSSNIDKRLYNHRMNANKIDNYIYNMIRDSGGIEFCNIKILEEVEYNDRQELFTRERHFIDTNENVINKNLPLGRTRAEYNKKYYDKNQDKILQYHKYKVECPCCFKAIHRYGLEKHQKSRNCCI